MAQVIIVSRAVVDADCVCVGGVDINNHCSLSLLDAGGCHELAADCPYQVWDIWDIDYFFTNQKPSPHTEDAIVVRRERLRTINASGITVERFANALPGFNVPLFRGSLFSTFGGMVKRGETDWLYVSGDGVPDYSFCFWINDRRLLGYESHGRWQYRYNDMSNKYGYTIPFVGAGEHPGDIEAGSLLCLSLAPWTKPYDTDDDARCYLQLSGCLIQGDGSVSPTDNWFDALETEMDRLLAEKASIEEKITDLRSRIIQQMEERKLDKFASSRYSVSYSPAKTTLQFDRKAFKAENEALYSAYCLPKLKEATLIVRKKKDKSDPDDEAL